MRQIYSCVYPQIEAILASINHKYSHFPLQYRHLTSITDENTFLFTDSFTSLKQNTF